MKEPTKLDRTFCARRSSSSSGVARGVTLLVAAAKAPSMVDSEKVVTASMEEAIIVRSDSTAVTLISSGNSQGSQASAKTEASAANRPTSPKNTARTQSLRLNCRIFQRQRVMHSHPNQLRQEWPALASRATKKAPPFRGGAFLSQWPEILRPMLR